MKPVCLIDEHLGAFSQLNISLGAFKRYGGGPQIDYFTAYHF